MKYLALLLLCLAINGCVVLAVVHLGVDAALTTYGAVVGALEDEDND